MNKENLSLGLEPSYIMDLSAVANARKKEIGKDNVFDFSLGSPYAEPPKKLKAKIKEFLSKKSAVELHGYTPTRGIYSARKAIADDLGKKFGLSLDPDLVYLTCGASSAIALSINALAEPGEEVILFAPYFSEYKELTRAAKVNVVEVQPDKDFQPDVSLLEKAINKKTRIIIMNSPNNPTGVLINETRMKEITDLLNKKEQEYGTPIYIIYDEPYRELVYDGKKLAHPLNYYDDVVVNYSFSKFLSIPGERIGYILVSSKCKEAKDIIASVDGTARKFGYVCAPSLFQHLIPELINEKVNLAFYQKNRDYFYQELTRIGYEVVHPDGAFYMFVKALGDDSEKFALKARDHELFFLPSEPFGYKGYVRISYSVPFNTIKNSIPAFKKLFDDYKR